MKNNLVHTFLSKDAIERLGRIKCVNPERAAMVEAQVIQVFFCL